VPRDIELKDDGPLAAIKWVLLNPAISTTVPYVENITQLKMNVRAMKEAYTPADEKMLYVRNEMIHQYNLIGDPYLQLQFTETALTVSLSTTMHMTSRGFVYDLTFF